MNVSLNPAKLKLNVTLPKLKFPLASLLQEPRTTVIQPLEDEKQDTALSPQSQEIMDKLDSKFYEDKTKFNATEYVLAMLPEQLDEKWFDEQLAAKESALNVVNSQLFKKVMANYESFVQGMTHIHELGLDLSTSGVVCKNGRRNLRTAKEQLTDRVAVIVAKYRKRQTYKEISDILTGIKKLVTADRQFGQSVEEGDFPKAIESVLECRSVVGQYKQYQSVVDLMNTLQEKYNVVQSKLDTALYEACRNFTDLGYQRILIAYRLLGQSGSVLERLQKYFIEAINTHTKNAIYAHVLIKEENSLKAELYKKKKFRELCEVLPGEHFFICLQTVLEILTDIMYGHYLMSQWHAQATAENTTNDESMKKYLDDIKDGLSKIKPTVWDNMQRKVSILISTTSTVADFQIDDFLKVLDSLNRFVEIGEEFTQTEAHTLRGSIKLQSREYFKNFHKTNIESLWTMLENEMWQRCPVSKNFIADSYSKEFNNFYRPEPNKSSKRSIFSTMKTLGNPFSRTTKKPEDFKKTNNPILVVEDEDLLDVDEIDEETGELKSNVAKDSEGPLVTTTTINVIRFIGKYIMMMKVLQPIAYEIFMGITQIWEYYIYSVYNTFGENPSASSGISPKLKYLISKLYQHFNHNPMESPESDSNSVLVTKVKLPKLNSMLEVTNPNNLFGISVRTVAVESIMMLEECLKIVKPHIGNAMPKARERNFNEFYLNTVDAVGELVKYITKTLALKFINWNVFMQHMNVARWEIKEVSTEQNSYVEFLLKEFQMMGRKLNRELKAGTLPTRVRNYIWEVSMAHLMEQLVAAYASIRTCTSEGRTSMSLDFKVLVNGLEKLSPIKPIPMVAFVDTFIKAYYLRDNEFGQWCKDHQEYSIKQMTSIMNLAPGLANSNKKQFTYIIEQVDKLKQPLPSNMPNTPMHAPSQSAFGASASTWFGAITGATTKKY